MNYEISKKKDIFISESASISHALKKLSITGLKCLIVAKNKKNFLGLVTDGDIRRALSKSHSFSSKIKNIYNKNPLTFKDKQNISKNLLEKYFIDEGIDLVPIINYKNYVIDYITIRDFISDNFISKHNQNIEFIIMAGGEGKRLLPYTKIFPKPLMPIDNTTLIEKIINKALSSGINKFTISINYKAELIKSYFAQIKPKYILKFIKEKKTLGTIGSLSLLKLNNKKSYIVSNCDVILDIDIDDFYRYHKKGKYELTLIVSDKHFKIPYGNIILNKDGNIKHIYEKPEYKLLVNVGFYIFEPSILKLIKKNTSTDIDEFLIKCIKARKKIGIYRISDNSWADYGKITEHKSLI